MHYPEANNRLEAYVSYLDRKFQAKNVTNLFNTTNQQSKFKNELYKMIEHLSF